MARYSFKIVDGKVVEYNRQDATTPIVSAPYVIGDTFDKPLQNPVTGTIHTSKSEYLKECDRHGLEVVGNDLLSKNYRRPEDKISESRMLEAIKQAEAIHSDPSRKRAWEYEQHVRLERVGKLLKENK